MVPEGSLGGSRGGPRALPEAPGGRSGAVFTFFWKRDDFLEFLERFSLTPGEGGGACRDQKIDKNRSRDEKGTSGNEPGTDFWPTVALKAVCIEIFFDFGSFLLNVSMKNWSVFLTKNVENWKWKSAFRYVIYGSAGTFTLFVFLVFFWKKRRKMRPKRGPLPRP